MKIDVSPEHLNFFQCFSSKTRLKIIELLSNNPKNIGELAGLLNVSSTIITRHISMLEKAGIITTENIPGKRGLQKKCKLNLDEITLNLTKNTNLTSCKYNHISIPIGHYSNYDICPTCGLVSTNNLIGVIDDPRYFSSPKKITASTLWFQSGWIEYNIPSYIFTSNNIKSLEISLEICSEYPGYKQNYPSDIYFYINNICIGMWVSPGDFGDKKGTYTPNWWNLGTQYGLLKTIKITNKETLLDGIHLSDVNLSNITIDYKKDITLKIESPTTTKNPGGITLFGKGFGNYNIDIEIRVLI